MRPGCPRVEQNQTGDSGKKEDDDGHAEFDLQSSESSCQIEQGCQKQKSESNMQKDVGQIDKAGGVESVEIGPV